MKAPGPLFITFEGGEGAGKTTQIVHLAGWLAERGVACTLTREPGGTDLGRKIRAILLDPGHAGMAPETELLLYMADRAEHIGTVIRPALTNGQTVLCDRYFDATLVYQGAARGLPADRILGLHALMFDSLSPDVTLLLDLPVHTGLARARRQLSKGARPRKESRFEDEALHFHERVRAGYLELARQHPARFRVIDAAADEERVKADIEQAVAPFLSRLTTMDGRRP